MFNQGKFNSLKFNTSTSGKMPITGYSSLNIGNNIVDALQEVGGKAEAFMRIDGKANGVTVLESSKGLSEMILDSTTTPPLIEKYITVYPSNMILGGVADHKLSGEEVVDLSTLSLKPGDELLIDTCNMTVTINGANAMRYFSDDSEFFKLKPGANDIVYTDKSYTRSVYIDVLWKDRWL